MQNENFIEKMSSNLSQSATIKNVFGEPIHVGEKTIIPVARVAYGFGGGAGEGHQTDGEQKPGKQGSGSGGGGGVHAGAKGVYEITPTGTRFIPASPYKYLLSGMLLGFLVKGFFAAGKKN